MYGTLNAHYYIHVHAHFHVFISFSCRYLLTVWSSLPAIRDTGATSGHLTPPLTAGRFGLPQYIWEPTCCHENSVRKLMKYHQYSVRFNSSCVAIFRCGDSAHAIWSKKVLGVVWLSGQLLLTTLQRSPCIPFTAIASNDILILPKYQIASGHGQFGCKVRLLQFEGRYLRCSHGLANDEMGNLSFVGAQNMEYATICHMYLHAF